MLTGGGLEIAKKPLNWVSRHVFFYVRQVFSYFPIWKPQGHWNSRTVGSRMVILLISWGLQIAKNHLNQYSKCVLSPTPPRIVPFENAKVPNFNGCSKQNGDSAYWLGPGNSSKTSISSFQTYISSAFSHLKVLNFKNLGKWNHCLLAGKGVEMAKKLLDWVSRHLFFYVRKVFLLFPHLETTGALKFKDCRK